MSEVSIRDLDVHEAIDEMVDAGVTKEQAHDHMQDAIKILKCDHEWKKSGKYALVCRKCNCLRICNTGFSVDIVEVGESRG